MISSKPFWESLFYGQEDYGGILTSKEFFISPTISDWEKLSRWESRLVAVRQDCADEWNARNFGAAEAFRDKLLTLETTHKQILLHVWGESPLALLVLSLGGTVKWCSTQGYGRAEIVIPYRGSHFRWLVPTVLGKDIQVRIQDEFKKFCALRR